MLLIKSVIRFSPFCNRFSSTNSVSICIVGSGPAGFYCAQHLLKVLPQSTIDIFEKLPVPFGLVRYGVAPDHPEVKNVINTFTKIGSDPRVRFIGNVTLGKDILLKDLKEAYHTVVLSYGANQDVKLQIPGENLDNVLSARRFVGWYNGLPDDKHLTVNLNTEHVAIFGQGNVAVDVARILLKSVDELKNTDITEHALGKLSESKVKTVHLIGRRGPLQVAFTIKEIREILKLPHTQTVLDMKPFQGIEAILPDLPRPRKRITELLLKTAGECQTQSQKKKKLVLTFLQSPVEFIGRDAVSGVKLTRNRLKNPLEIPPENQKAEATDETEHLPCNLVLRSIGYRSTKEDPDIPFKSSSYIGSSRVLPGVYSAGWLSTGPTGVILSTMSNAFSTANLILEDVSNSNGGTELKPGYEYIKTLLRKQGIVTVSWEGWKKIDDLEIQRGKDRHKPREKITDLDEMIEIGGSIG